MDLQLLEFFVATADAGSFTAASERLHYAQSNLSTRIAQMETELGTKLFYRYRKGISLTSKGHTFYQYAVRILSLSEEAKMAMLDQDTAQGKLLLGSIEAAALTDLPPLFSSYHKKYPEVEISLRTELNDIFPEQVLDRTLDGAFVTGPVRHPALVEIPFRKVQLIFVGNDSYEQYSAQELLENAPLITVTDGSSFRRRMELLLSSHDIA